MTKTQANLMMGFCFCLVLVLGGIFGNIIGSGNTVGNFLIIIMASSGAWIIRNFLLKTIIEK